MPSLPAALRRFYSENRIGPCSRSFPRYAPALRVKLRHGLLASRPSCGWPPARLHFPTVGRLKFSEGGPRQGGKFSRRFYVYVF